MSSKKAAAEELEEKEEDIVNPFEDYPASFWQKLKFLQQFRSERVFKTNLTPTQPAAHLVPRRRSLPGTLTAPEEDEEGQPFTLEPSLLPIEYKKSVVVSRRRKLSGVVSMSEATAREMVATLAEEATREGADEAAIENKLLYWEGGHERFELVLTSKSLMKDDFYFLGYVLKFNMLIQKLDLSKCFVTDDDFLLLVQNMDMNVVLSVLLLRQTKVGDKGLTELANLMRRNHTITELDVRQTTLTVEGGRQLVRCIQNNPALLTVNTLPVAELKEEVPDTVEFRERFLGLADMVLLCHLVQGRKNVTVLDLHKNVLGPKASSGIVDILSVLPSLTRLDLGENRIGSQGCEALAKFFEHNTTILEMDLSLNGLMLFLPQKNRDPTGVSALANTLISNTTLTTLNHEGNEMDEDLGRWLDERVTVNRALSYNNSREECHKVFKEHVESLVPQGPGSRGTGYELTLETQREFLEAQDLLLPDVALDLGEAADGYTLHPKIRAANQPKKVVPKKQGTKYNANMNVMGRWKVDGRLYPGTITMVNPDGTFNVKFKDGTMATSLQRNDLRPGHYSGDARWDP